MALHPFPRPTQIIAATDGSDLSEVAVFGARQLADQLGLELRVIHGISRVESPDSAIVTAARRQASAANAQLDLIELEEHFLSHASTALAQHMDAMPGALLCLGSHGRGGARAAVLGSVATEVVHRIEGPLLVFGPNATAPDKYRRVVACTDGSSFASLAVDIAARFARDLDLPLWVVDAVEPDQGDTPFVVALGHELAALGIKANWDTLHSHRPGPAIVDFVDAEPGTISVLATHGRTGWRELLMGSVATNVVRHAKGPVLLARPTAILRVPDASPVA